MRHMNRYHKALEYWLCYACGEVPGKFHTEHAYIEHLECEHQDTVAPDHVQAFASAAFRRAPMELENCPLCPPEAHAGAEATVLLKHIAAHVHKYSLQSLPELKPSEEEVNWVGLQSYFNADSNPYFDIRISPFESKMTNSTQSDERRLEELPALESAEDFQSVPEVEGEECVQSDDFLPEIIDDSSPPSPPERLSDDGTSIHSQHHSQTTRVPDTIKILHYSDLEGPQAVRLFVEHARENGCNNVRLIQILENESRRDSLAALTGDVKKDLLPTKERIDRAFGPSDTLFSLLCCRCRLCDRNDGFKNLVRNAKILDDSEKRKELAILILSGCLFALKDLCTQANFQVVRFAARIPTSPPQSHPYNSSCLSRIAHVPTECSHEYFDRDDQLCSMRDICIECRKRAFQSATAENSIVVDIPKLERTSLILDYSDQNIPFIQECPQEKLNVRLTPRFLTSQIEPSCCDEELKVSSIQRML